MDGNDLQNPFKVYVCEYQFPLDMDYAIGC